MRPARVLHAEYVWLPAGGSVPVLRSDVATLGMERWLGKSWLASATVYGRVADGVAVPDPTPGSPLGRPIFVAGRNTARGIDMSARRLTGRLTGSVAYSHAVSEISASGLHYPAPTDRRHVVDATAQFRIASAWLVGVAWTAASGAPYTRAFGGTATCDDVRLNCRWIDEPWVGEPGAQRARATQSLDLLAEWSRQAGILRRLRRIRRVPAGRSAAAGHRLPIRVLSVDVAVLFAEHHAELFRYLARLTGDPDVAADAAQEAFVKLMEKPPAPGETRAWLFRVGSNVALEVARTRARRLKLVSNAPERMPLADAPLTPEHETERAAVRDAVRAALAELTERDRTVLLLREEGFSHREIAEQVGTTTGSVGTIIARALEKLAAALELDGEDVA